MHIKSRLKSLRAVMREKELDAILIPSVGYPESSTVPNVYYFTGYYDVWPSCMLMTQSGEMLLTFEPEKARETTDFRTILDLREHRISEQLKDMKGGRLNIGIDGNIDYNYYTALKEKLPKSTLTDISREIYAIRAIKDEKEITEIKNACLLTDRVLSDVESAGFSGNSEKQIAERIKQAIVATGKEWSFPVIAAGDAGSSFIHANSTTHKFKNSLLIDMGIKSNFYSSDMTRTFIFSSDPEIRKAYSDLKELHSYLGENIVPGMDSKGIDQLAHDFLEKKGHKTTSYSNFHSLGHGVGLEVHEHPVLNRNVSYTLKRNMVFTLEPGIYVPGKYGIRLEDTVVLKTSGIERLTRFPL